MKFPDNQKFVWRQGSTSVQCLVYTDAQGAERCEFTAHHGKDGKDGGNMTVPEYLALKNGSEREPGEQDCIVIPWNELSSRIIALEDQKFVTPWTEISEDKWDEMLNVLPPEKWQTVGGVNIFRMCEYYTSNITMHYARCGGRFFSRQCRTSIPYETLAFAVRALCMPARAEEVPA